MKQNPLTLNVNELRLGVEATRAFARRHDARYKSTGSRSALKKAQEYDRLAAKLQSVINRAKKKATSESAP